AALPAISATCPDLRYVVVGEGPDLPRLRSLAGELGVLDRVTFTGRLDDAAVVALYHACDLFLMPSRTTLEPPNVEGFGISFLEAAACGKPVIGGRSGGIPDAVIDGITGLLVDPNDPRQIAAAALAVLRDPGYARSLGKAGRERAAGRSWAAVGTTARALLAERTR
ncbi:MAG TPA: glycosyltransferase, partial [Candidatus Edwardsbacteria bacterium]|nr:glycosyltransferase [Candidatus Edwardsbacteria bacterium]